MCRMLLAVGKFDTPILFEGLKRMALDQNERHEENEKVLFQHGDGWGMTYLHHDSLNSYKSSQPCYQDLQFENLSKISTRFLILHSRRASKGSIGEQNSHPFLANIENDNYFFYHNGTIYEELPFSNHFHRSGTTDSEMFFFHILTHLKPEKPIESYKSIFKKVTNFSAVNSIFGNSQFCLLVNRYQINPDYYTMKISSDDHSLIVSSEIIPGLPAKNWKKLSNGTLLKIPINNSKISFEEYQLIE
ncbi:class II glutamine amidotransferase [candidate division KSB1 bacterium]|nr:class II glutamine amidotransferase [candidate division KSB1 bacterium]